MADIVAVDAGPPSEALLQSLSNRADAQQAFAMSDGEGQEGYQSVVMDEAGAARSEEHTSELQSLMRISYAVFCLKKKKHTILTRTKAQHTSQITHTLTK